jgi:hypothetical protein
MAATLDIPPHMQCSMAGVSKTAAIYGFGFLQIPSLRVPTSVSNAVGHRMLYFPQPLQTGRGVVFRSGCVNWAHYIVPLCLCSPRKAVANLIKTPRFRPLTEAQHPFTPNDVRHGILFGGVGLWGPACGHPCHRCG